MTKTYVYKEDTFDSWRIVTNAHSDQIGDISQKQTNSSGVTKYVQQQYLEGQDHVDVASISIDSIATGTTTFTTTDANAYKLRNGMNVIAKVGTTQVSPDICVIESITYNAGNVIFSVPTSQALTFSPTPATVVFTFTANVTSYINDLEFKKVNRNGDRMTEALTIDSLTSSTGALNTNEVNFNLVNTNATTVNMAGAGTTISIGNASGTTTINNANTVVTGDLAVNGGDLTTSAGTFNILNTNATSINFGGAGTSVTIGAVSGTTTIRNANTVVAGDLAVNGGDITTNMTTASLYNTTATTLSVAGQGTTISIGASSGGSNSLGGTTTVNNVLVVNNLTVDTITQPQSVTKDYTATVATTSPTTLFTFDSTLYRSAEVIIQSTQGITYSVTKFLMTHNGTDTYETEFGSLGTAPGTYDTALSAPNWTLAVTQSAVTSTVYKVHATLIKI